MHETNCPALQKETVLLVQLLKYIKQQIQHAYTGYSVNTVNSTWPTAGCQLRCPGQQGGRDPGAPAATACGWEHLCVFLVTGSQTVARTYFTMEEIRTSWGGVPGNEAGVCVHPSFPAPRLRPLAQRMGRELGAGAGSVKDGPARDPVGCGPARGGGSDWGTWSGAPPGAERGRGRGRKGSRGLGCGGGSRTCIWASRNWKRILL